jgi:cell division protease FtsH
MVCEWGMSENLGPIAFGRKDEQIFLGRDIALHKDYSEQTAIEIDREVRRIVSEAYQRARALLADNLDVLHAVADHLLEKEVLNGSEVEAIMKRVREGESAPESAVSPTTPPSGPETARDKAKQPERDKESGVLVLPPKPALA